MRSIFLSLQNVEARQGGTIEAAWRRRDDPEDLRVYLLLGGYKYSLPFWALGLGSRVGTYYLRADASGTRLAPITSNLYQDSVSIRASGQK
jgi:hypothetical protein